MSDEKIKELAKAAVSNIPKEITVAEWGGTERVNCYAFAANCRKPGRAKPDPGDASGYDPKDNGRFTADRLIAGAKRDGMIYRGTAQTDPPFPTDGHYLVALYLSADAGDHHWYRKDPDYGRWVHKPGPQNIRNFGVSFKILPTELVMITHDYGNARTNYKFVAFFEVPDDGIQVG
jgi:hypothetical protein